MQMLAPTAPSPSPRVVGIDVGGPVKGFHAVALDGLDIVAHWRGSDVAALASWCEEQKAAGVAIDAPCRWRGPGPARAAERELAAEGISCYYAPTEQRAREHAFYKWMLPGADLYRALAGRFPLYLGGAAKGPVAIETFPQAVACALAGKVVSAKPKEKRVVRRELLQRAGITLRGDENIRWLTGYDDAALRRQIAAQADFQTFFAQAPAVNPKRALLKGAVSGVRIEEIDDSQMKEIRYLDKLVDDLAKGRAREKILPA